MFIRFNYRCSTCEHEEERFIKKTEMDNQLHVKCASGPFPQKMTRLPAAPRTTFRFHDKKLKR